MIRDMLDKAVHPIEEDVVTLTPEWFVFSALGLYPLCPGTDEYVLGVPAFKKTTLYLEGEKSWLLKLRR